MRVALVVHKFPPASVGGTEIYTRNLARELSHQGHEASVFYRADSESGPVGAVRWEERDGFRACRVSKGPVAKAKSPVSQFLDTFFNPSVEKAFDSFLDETEPDLVHFQHLMLLSYRLIAAAKRKELPVLLTLHDYWFICANSQLVWPDAEICRGKAFGLNCARCVLAARLSSSLMPLLRPPAAALLQIRDLLVRRAALRADQLIAPSRFLIRQHVEAGWPAGRLIHLENGIDVERIRRYTRRPSPDDRVRFTYLGSLAWQKGVHVLVEAFQGVSPAAAHLRIYGDPTVFPQYSDALRDMANPANTSFEGSVPNEEVGRVLAETDILVVPSLWYENSPVVIQEALAAGVPVIASRIGALIEKASLAREVFLFPPGDVDVLSEVIERVLSRPGRLDCVETREPRATAIKDHVVALQRIYADSLD